MASAASVAGAAAKAKGAALEERVARLLRAEGRARVRTNVLLRDGFGNLSEVDVVAGRWLPLYVECKAYASGSPVPLEDVAKFKSVLGLLGVPARRGLFVTTSTYTPRAATLGIRTVDGAGLASWERRVARLVVLRSFLRGVALTLAAFAGAVAFAPEIGDAVRHGVETSTSKALGKELSVVLAALLALNTEAREGWRRGRTSAGVPQLWGVDLDTGVRSLGRSTLSSPVWGEESGWSRLSAWLSPPPGSSPLTTASFEAGRMSVLIDDKVRQARREGVRMHEKVLPPQPPMR
jgi:hypothetical protein